MASSHSLIFIGGDPPHPSVRHHLPLDAFVIAADSGYAHAIAMGFVPHELVGDMDSITAVDLSDARDLNINITQFSTDKDLTDTEIAIASAIARNSTHITLVSGGGDRFDHVLAMVHSLATCALTIDIISLIPLGGNAVVTTTGLQWELNSDTLQSFASRGVSNIAMGESITISVTDGSLAVVEPFFLNPGDIS
jgi:thiamine pyrophosphokinase